MDTGQAVKSDEWWIVVTGPMLCDVREEDQIIIDKMLQLGS
jgi:hypothetical protein